LRKIYHTFKISDLEKKASKKLSIEEVFKYGKNYDSAINFLRKQNLLPYQNIENLISFQKNEKYPIGYMMLNRNNAVVGFVGTWFSERKIKDYASVFCNIHSWIVQQEYRLYSFYLISLLNKKNINLTAFTPVESLKGLLLKFGFEKKEISYKIILNLKLFKFNKNYKIIKNKEDIEKRLNKINLNIYNFYSNKVYKNFLIKDIKEEKDIFITGCLLKKKSFQIFNFFYVSDKNYFKKNWDKIADVISNELNIYFFSEYILADNENIFPDKIFFSKIKKKEIYFKSENELCNLDLLNSDLVI
jgi:hypothetical protein